MIWLLPFLTAAFARLSGWGAKEDGYAWVSRFPAEVALSLAIAVPCAIMHGGSIYWLYGATVWTFFTFNLGHGNAYHDGTLQTQYPDRWQKLDYIVRPITNRLGWAPRSTWYCRFFMGVKGLLIGLPIFPFGLPLAILWPLSYAIGFRLLNLQSRWAEVLTGFFLGWCSVWVKVHHG